MRRLLLSVALLAAVPARAAFYAAAGKVDVTPDPKASTVWLAGYGASGRRAVGVEHPLYARALVLSDRKKTVALVAVDAIGLSRADVTSWRAELGWDDPAHYLFAAATHSHSAPDTMGLWGRFPGVSGVDPEYRRRLREAVSGLVRRLSGELREAQLAAGRKNVDPRGVCTDDRDPVVIDPELAALRVTDKATRKTIATLVRWSCHPVTLTEANLRISSDFPGPLCDRIEAVSGGACVYFSGSIGGHLLPETDRSAPVPVQIQDAKRIGERIADEAFTALKTADPVRGGVDFHSKTVRVPVENSRFLLFLPSLAFGHVLQDAAGTPLPRWKIWWLPLRHLLLFPLPERLRPWVETEVSRVDVGDVRVLGVPAEIFSELVVGGYDGSLSFGHPLTRPGSPNPPRLAEAPQGPYLRDKLRAKHGIVVSLANDELGYLVPSYDFQEAHTRSMLPEPQGTHYEETNSIGARATPILLAAFDALLK